MRRRIGDCSLNEFLREAQIELSDLIGKSGRNWTRARRDAGFSVPTGGPREADLLKRVAAFTHVDDPDRAAAYLRLLADEAPTYDALSEEDQRWARMLFFSLWPNANLERSYTTGLEDLRAEPAVRAELAEVISLGLANAAHRTRPLSGALSATGLRSHARYTREELAAACDYATLNRTPTLLRQGVFYTPAYDTDALLVTLQKSEEDYSPTTMYRDYAISPGLFHWESQAGTRVETTTGQRYVNQRENGNHILLFARNSKSWEFGKGVPYMLLGEADYVSHRGELPIAITWHLRRSMPADEYRSASVAAG